MARHNNTGRSLIIISKEQGWDPNTIEDVGNGPGHPKLAATDISNVYFPRETPFAENVTDIRGIPSVMKDSSEPCPDPAVNSKDFETPVLRENQNHRTRNANPYPGMPGAK